MALEDLLSRYTPKASVPRGGELYVALNGNDESDGSFERPFASLERAQKAARDLVKQGKPVTVCVRAGEYHTKGLRFTEEDSGAADRRVTYRAYGDGKVFISSTTTLKGGDFKLAPEEIRARLHGDAKDSVLCVDLTKYGLSPEDWGELCPIGSFGTESKYDGVQTGANVELFVNGQRMTLARYPAEDFLEFAAVADVGDAYEFPEQNYHYDWNDRRNHRGGTYIMDKQTTARAAQWQDKKDIWIYGYFYHDWADASSPVESFDTEHRSFCPRFVARYGARKGGRYFFYNVLDELDRPGQWYLDRESGKLYVYPPCDLKTAEIELNLRKNSVFTGENADYITLEGFDVKGACADGITWNGSDNEFIRLTVHSVTGNAMKVKGYRNLVSECEMYDMGKGGVLLDGGVRETLTPGENRVDNCLIHDFGKITQMYCSAVRLDGVGNVCSHNEMYDAPHTAIFYYGNDHVMEYNYIHDVVQQSSDAGAIYSGQDWTGQGCVLRYNVIKDIGRGGFTPNGIYFDDMLSGQTAYGNLIVNVKANGFLVGGGRDNKVLSNVIVSCGTAVSYDDRAREGFVNNGWTIAAVNNYDTSMMWVRLRKMPYTSEIWAKKYPSLARVSTDFSDPDNPDFPVNPSYGEVCGNVVVDKDERLGEFFTSVPRYSTIENNAVFRDTDSAGLDENLELKPDSPVWEQLKDFKRIPLEKIGRY